jgi:hypothetical protein
MPHELTVSNDLLDYNRVMYDNETQKAIYLIHNNQGDNIGHVARSYAFFKTYFTKSLTVKHSNVGSWPMMHFSKSAYWHRSPARLIVVEDILSSIAVDPFCPAVALIGTQISIDMLCQIPDSVKRVDVWLDPDATSQAMRVRNRLRAIGYDSRLILSDKDPKDLSPREIKQYVGE